MRIGLASTTFRAADSRVAAATQWQYHVFVSFAFAFLRWSRQVWHDATLFVPSAFCFFNSGSLGISGTSRFVCTGLSCHRYDRTYWPLAPTLDWRIITNWMEYEPNMDPPPAVIETEYGKPYSNWFSLNFRPLILNWKNVVKVEVPCPRIALKISTALKDF